MRRECLMMDDSRSYGVSCDTSGRKGARKRTVDGAVWLGARRFWRRDVNGRERRRRRWRVWRWCWCICRRAVDGLVVGEQPRAAVARGEPSERAVGHLQLQVARAAAHAALGARRALQHLSARGEALPRRRLLPKKITI